MVRQQLTTDSVDRVIQASSEVLYDIVADVTRTPELSPEITSCTWLDGVTEARVGARFRARNTVGRGPDWHNEPVVTAAERGRVFAFARTERAAGTVVWTYRFTPQDAGTRVTETYEVTAPLSWFGWFIIGPVYGCRDRRADLRRGMTTTLARLAAVAEQPTGPSRRSELPHSEPAHPVVTDGAGSPTGRPGARR